MVLSHWLLMFPWDALLPPRCPLLPAPERCSGHRHHHVIGQLVVVGCEAVRPGMHPLLVRHARFGMGTSSLHSLLRNRQLKKALFSCTHGTEVQHISSSSDGFYASSRLKSCSTCWISTSWCAVTCGDTSNVLKRLQIRAQATLSSGIDFFGAKRRKTNISYLNWWRNKEKRIIRSYTIKGTKKNQSICSSTIERMKTKLSNCSSTIEGTKTKRSIRSSTIEGTKTKRSIRSSTIDNLTLLGDTAPCMGFAGSGTASTRSAKRTTVLYSEPVCQVGRPEGWQLYPWVAGPCLLCVILLETVDGVHTM